MSHFVLVVDDDAIVTELLEDWLQEEGCLVATAHTGVEALDLLEGLTPDLILCDYIMPEMDGIEFLRRSQASCPDACRILITGNGNLRVAVEAINEANVYKFIEKPLKRDGLMITVRRALEHSELNQRIIQSDKLASLGQLAAGVAHEIKSPAAFLSSNIQILRDYVEVLEKIADVKSELSRVAGTGVSAPHLADRLETFWREEGVDEVLGDLSGLIDDAAHRRSIRSLTSPTICWTSPARIRTCPATPT